MGRGRFIGAEFDATIHEPLLHRHREEFPATIRLDPLDRKWHFFDDAFQEGERTGRRASREYGQDSVPCAVIDRGVLITPWSDLTGIELHTIPGNEAGIPMARLPPSWANQRGHLIGNQYLVNRVK